MTSSPRVPGRLCSPREHLTLSSSRAWPASTSGSPGERREACGGSCRRHRCFHPRAGAGVRRLLPRVRLRRAARRAGRRAARTRVEAGMRRPRKDAFVDGTLRRPLRHRRASSRRTAPPKPRRSPTTCNSSPRSRRPRVPPILSHARRCGHAAGCSAPTAGCSNTAAPEWCTRTRGPAGSRATRVSAGTATGRARRHQPMWPQHRLHRAPRRDQPGQRLSPGGAR